MTPIDLLRNLSEESSAQPSLPASVLIEKAFVWDPSQGGVCRRNTIQGRLANLLQKSYETIPFKEKLRQAFAQALVTCQEEKTPFDRVLTPSLALSLMEELAQEIETAQKRRVANPPEIETLLQAQVEAKEAVRQKAMRVEQALLQPEQVQPQVEGEHVDALPSSLLHHSYEGKTYTLETAHTFFGLKEPKNLDFLKVIEAFLKRKPVGWDVKFERVKKTLAQEQKLNEELVCAGIPLPEQERNQVLAKEADRLVTGIENLKQGQRFSTVSSYGLRKINFFSFCQTLQTLPLHFLEEWAQENGCSDLLKLFQEHSYANPENFARALYRLIVSRLQKLADSQKAQIQSYLKLDPESPLLYADPRRTLNTGLKAFLPDAVFKDLENKLQLGILGNLNPNLVKVSEVGGVALSAERDVITSELEPMVVEWIQRRFMRFKGDQGWSGIDQLGEDLRTSIPPALIELFGIDPLLAQGPIWLEFEKREDGIALEVYTTGLLQTHLQNPATRQKYRLKRFTQISLEKLTPAFFFHHLKRHHDGLWDARRVLSLKDFYDTIERLGGKPEHNGPEDPVETAPLRTIAQLGASLLLPPEKLLALKFEILCFQLSKQLNGQKKLELTDPALHALANNAYRSLSKEVAGMATLSEKERKSYEVTLQEIGMALLEKDNQKQENSLQNEIYQEGIEGKLRQALAKGGITQEKLDQWRGRLRAHLGDELGDLADHLVSGCQNLPFPSPQEVPQPAPYGWNFNTYTELYSDFAKNILAIGMAAAGFSCGGWYRLWSLPMAYRLATRLLSPSLLEGINSLLEWIARTVGQLAVKIAYLEARELKKGLQQVNRQLAFGSSQRHQVSFAVDEDAEKITLGKTHFPGYRAAQGQKLDSLQGHGGYLILEGPQGSKVAMEGDRYFHALAWRGLKYLGPLAETALDQSSLYIHVQANKLANFVDIYKSESHKTSSAHESPLFVYDLQADGRLSSSEPDALVYLLVLELLKEEDSPELSRLWQNLMEATFQQSQNGKNGFTRAWESVFVLSWAFQGKIPYLKQQFRTEMMAFYRIRLIAHLQKNRSIFGEPKWKDTALTKIAIGLAYHDLNWIIEQKNPRLQVSDDEKKLLAEFFVEGMFHCFKEQFHKSLPQWKPPKKRRVEEVEPGGVAVHTEEVGPVEADDSPNTPEGRFSRMLGWIKDRIDAGIGSGKSFLLEEGGADFVEHFLLSPALAQEINTMRKRCGHETTRASQARGIVFEALKAPFALPNMGSVGSSVSTEAFFNETNGGHTRSVFEFLSAARRSLLQNLKGQRIIDNARPCINPNPVLDSLVFSQEHLEKDFFSYYAIAEQGGEKNEKLATLLCDHRNGWDPHTRALIDLLQAVSDSPPCIFDPVGRFIFHMLFDHFDFSPLLKKMDPTLVENPPFDSQGFVDEHLKKYFFTYYAIACGECGPEKKAQLSRLLEQHREEKRPYERLLLFVLEAANAHPIHFDKRQEFLQFLKNEQVGKNKPSNALQMRMQMVHAGKAVLPIMKFYFAAWVAGQTISRSTTRLVGENNPVTQVANERLFNSLIRWQGNSALKSGLTLWAMQILKKIPVDAAGSALGTVAYYTGLTSPATSIAASYLGTVGVRIGLSLCNQEPISWRQIIPKPTVMIPVINAIGKGVQIVQAMNRLKGMPVSPLSHVQQKKRPNDPALAETFQAPFEAFFAEIEGKLANSIPAIEIWVALKSQASQWAQEKEALEHKLLQIFNPFLPRLITLDHLHLFVHKGNWGNLNREPLYLKGEELLFQLKLALHRLNAYDHALNRCTNAIAQVKKFISSPSRSGVDEIRQALEPPLPGVFDPFVKDLYAQCLPEQLTVVEFPHGKMLVDFAKGWQQATRIPAVLGGIAPTQSDFTDLILNIDLARKEGLPLLMVAGSRENLVRLENEASEGSKKKNQIALIIKALEGVEAMSFPPKGQRDRRDTRDRRDRPEGQRDRRDARDTRDTRDARDRPRDDMDI